MGEGRQIRWYVIASGGYGEEVRASGSLSLEEWIDPPQAAAIAAGALAGVNDAAHEAGLLGGSPFADGSKVAIILDYPERPSSRGGGE